MQLLKIKIVEKYKIKKHFMLMVSCRQWGSPSGEWKSKPVMLKDQEDATLWTLSVADLLYAKGSQSLFDGALCAF